MTQIKFPNFYDIVTCDVYIVFFVTDNPLPISCKIYEFLLFIQTLEKIDVVTFLKCLNMALPEYFRKNLERLFNFRVDVSTKISLIFWSDILVEQCLFYLPLLSPPDCFFKIFNNFFTKSCL